MAIKPEELANSTAGSAEYPDGSFKDASSPAALDGTPLVQDWPNDLYGFFQRLLSEGAVTASGVADTVLASDYHDAMRKVYQYGLFYDDSGAGNAFQLASATGAVADSYFDGMVVAFEPVTDNTGAATLQVGALGAVDLVDSSGAALTGGEILTGKPVFAQYLSGPGEFWLTAFSNYVVPNVTQMFTAQQYFSGPALVSGASIPWNLKTQQSTYLLLGTNGTLQNPTNIKPRGQYDIEVVQDGVGGFTLAYDTAFEFSGGTPPTLSTAIGAIDLLTFRANEAGDALYLVPSLDFS